MKGSAVCRSIVYRKQFSVISLTSSKQKAQFGEIGHQFRWCSSASSSVPNEWVQEIKPFSSIPGPPRIPILGTLLPYKLGIRKLPTYHKDVCNLFEKYGPVVREAFGSQIIVHLFDPSDIRQVYENDGKTPHIPPLQETTQFYRQQKDMSLGLGNINGEDWYKLRHAVRQMMLRPKEVGYYYPLQDGVAKDAVDQIQKTIDSNGVVPNLHFLVGKWILESAGMCCFEKSLGSFRNDESGKLAQKLVEANIDIFKLSAELKFSLRLYRFFQTPKYNKLHAIEDFFYGVSIQFITETMREISSLVEKGRLEEGKFNFLSYLMSRKELSEKDIITITLSLFSDGLSTTAPTLLGNLHCLSLNPKAQDRLYQEVMTHVDPDAPITLNTVNKLHYMKAFVKEVFSEPILSREESEEFISRVLCMDLPSCYPPSLDWINKLVRAFQSNIPFQNISFLSKDSHDSVPSWEEIYKEIIVEGKGGLCLSLNVAFAAVLSSLGTTAYNISADYVAGEERGVHALTIIHCGDISTVNKSSIVTRSRTGNLARINYNYNIGDEEKDSIKRYGLLEVPEKFVYLIDVGCGYPTLRAINLKEDLEKVFFDCGLEYCIVKKGQRYFRMHRRGHDLEEPEKKWINNTGWLPMFSFGIVPRPLSCFQSSMKTIYVYRATSSYFNELHAVLYFSQTEMAAVKNEELIKYLGRKQEKCKAGASSKSMISDSEEKGVVFGNRRKLKLSELTVELLRNFPMIPKWEIEKAVLCYISQKITVGLN